MSLYRLKPRLPFWKIAGLVAVLLVLPAAVSPIVPDIDDDRTNVVLGQEGFEWKIPITWPEGAPLVCEQVDDSFYSSWECDGATVSSIVAENVIDRKNSLKRATRAMTEAPFGPGRFSGEGDVLLYETEYSTAISTQGTGDNEGKTLIAVVSGKQQHPYAALLLNNVRGTTEEIPELDAIGSAA